MSDDNPDWTDADFARARPFPELARKLKAQGGRPRLERPKVHVGFRLAADVVAGIKATGRGYNARVETRAAGGPGAKANSVRSRSTRQRGRQPSSVP